MFIISFEIIGIIREKNMHSMDVEVCEGLRSDNVGEKIVQVVYLVDTARGLTELMFRYK